MSDIFKERQLIGAIEQGNSSSRFLLFDAECNVVSQHQVEVKQILPKDGWFELDPQELLDSVRECLEEVGMRCAGEDLKQIKGIGITNQRETTILWDKTTGQCLHNAIVWCDVRTADIAEELIAETPSKSKDDLRPRCGLLIHHYFSALKVKWLMENSDAVRTAIEQGRCLFGTVDSWIIWHLTGGVNGGVHVTDVTNASRTMLMNIHTLQWDPDLCRFFGIPQEILPVIKCSAEVYGHIANGSMKDIPICGCLGDQQAALVGQHCFFPGEAKNTYGTGSFLLCNTGEQPVMSHHGMLTTVAYQLGPNKPVTYALEGAASTADHSVRWLRDMEFIKDASEIEGYASQVADMADVYFVPAFSGLFAPYWQADARGLIIGLTNYTNKAHLCKATLEAMCFQSREILEAMNQDLVSCPELTRPLASLLVDGGMTANRLLLQLQADLLGIPVVHPEFSEMTVLGAAIAAGTAVGVWKDLSQLPRHYATTYQPTIGQEQRDARCARWKEAVQRSMQWARSEQHRRKNSKDSKTNSTAARTPFSSLGAQMSSGDEDENSEKKMMALEGSVLQRGESPQLVQESLKSQSSKEAHAQVTTSAYLRGVNVIGETTCLVTNEAQTFHWKGYGLKLHIPPASLPPEVRQSSVNIKASLTGQFQFPGNTTLVSAVYWIQTPVMFHRAVTLEIQHCAKSTTRYPLSFAVAKCSQKDLPYQFKPLKSGAFSSFSSYASIALLHFSGLGVTQEAEVSELLYCAKQYYVGSKINCWRAHFVVTKDLEAYLTSVNKVFSGKGCVEGPDQEIEFAEDKITLEITESGLVMQNGWSIIPLTPLTITRRKVDSYECGSRIPSCQFQIKQSMGRQRAELYHRVQLQGAKEPFDFIVVESDSLPSIPADGKTDIYPAASLSDVPSQSRAITIECKPKQKELMSALYHKVAHRWKHLGVYLELPPATLDAIARDEQQSSQDCLVEMLTTWLKRVDPSPTWSAIVEAVEFLGEVALARELRTKYCQ